jgi:predicted ATPase
MTLVREVTIENYKSIRKLTLELGRVNVLIGANGSGKSNLLEGIAFGCAAIRKQVIFTTHNPAVLDGLDLEDDEQRLIVTERGKDGATRARRVQAPKPLDGDPPVPLSEAFVRGYLGGLPKNF